MTQVTAKKSYIKEGDSYVIPYVNPASQDEAGVVKIDGSSITIDVDGVIHSQGAISTDDLTITKNTSDEIQAVGVIDSNAGGVLKSWSGTRAQYDAIEVKDANTLYNITDDTDVTLTVLEALYPVGAIYIGTMAACPLEVLGVGTWQLRASDRVLQGAGTRGNVGDELSESLPNITGQISSVLLSGGATSSGAFSDNGSTTSNATGTGSTTRNLREIYFNASRSSSTYQDGTPVQQDAYLVNIWERIS